MRKLINAMEEAVEKIKQWPEKTVRLFHHNDSDGLTSGAILTRTFERAGFTVLRYCLEKTYPEVLKMVFKHKQRLIVFTDFAGRIAPLISEMNQMRNLVLILDHHKALKHTDPMVFNLNPELFGLKGDQDITASTTCYLFARTLDQANSDLAPIAVIGAVGDGFFVDGRLANQNREVALKAADLGLLEIREHDSGESYFYKSPKGLISCHELAACLDTLGAAGYYSKGPDMGIRVCLEGTNSKSHAMFKKLQGIQNRIFAEEIQRIGNGELKQTKHIQWFHVQNRFSPMGVKMIGAFCSMYKNTRYFNPEKYIAGFQTIPNNIPEFGHVSLNQVKISMRVSGLMEDKIRLKKAPGLDTFLPEATGRLGGFSDACHSLAAATTVAMGKEEALIKEMNTILNSAL